MPNLARTDAVREAFPALRGECGARGRICNARSGSFGLSARPALRPVCEKLRCHPCRSGACECFHRHWPAATRHGAPNQIGGDGSKQWLVIARAQRRAARTVLFTLPLAGRVDAQRAAGWGWRGFVLIADFPLRPPPLALPTRGREKGGRIARTRFYLTSRRCAIL